MPGQKDTNRPDSPGRYVMLWSLAMGGIMFLAGLLAAAKNGWDNDLPMILATLPLLTALGIGVGWLMQKSEGWQPVKTFDRPPPTAQLSFPVAVFSSVGNWARVISGQHGLTVISDGLLIEWEAATIYDSAGRSFTVVRAFRSWPRSFVGNWLCRMLGQRIGVGVDLSEPKEVSFAELLSRLSMSNLLPEHATFTRLFQETKTHRDLLECACQHAGG